MATDGVMMHRVKDLFPEQKLAVESLLGHCVSEDESVSIRALASTAITPSRLNDEQRAAALGKLNRYRPRGCPASTGEPRGRRSDEDTECSQTDSLRLQPWYGKSLKRMG